MKSAWFQQSWDNPAAPDVVVALAAAGGGSVHFRRWRGLLPKAVSLLAVTLPGRQHRVAERAPTDVQEVVSALAPAVAAAATGKRLVVVGSCLGAYVGTALVRALDLFEVPTTTLVVLSAGAPSAPTVALRSTATDAELLARVGALRGASDLAIVNSELAALIVPPLRTDIQLCASFLADRESVRCPVPTDVVAVRGARDPVVDEPSITAWAAHVAAPWSFASHELDGGHFLAEECPAEVVQIVLGCLERATTV